MSNEKWQQNLQSTTQIEQHELQKNQDVIRSPAMVITSCSTL